MALERFVVGEFCGTFVARFSGVNPLAFTLRWSRELPGLIRRHRSSIIFLIGKSFVVLPLSQRFKPGVANGTLITALPRRSLLTCSMFMEQCVRGQLNLAIRPELATATPVLSILVKLPNVHLQRILAEEVTPAVATTPQRPHVRELLPMLHNFSFFCKNNPAHAAPRLPAHHNIQLLWTMHLNRVLLQRHFTLKFPLVVAPAAPKHGGGYLARNRVLVLRLYIRTHLRELDVLERRNRWEFLWWGDLMPPGATKRLLGSQGQQP